MTKYKPSADASQIYREGTSTNFASLESSADCGNLSDAMRDAILVFPPLVLPTIRIFESGEQ
jgi:hypothetical protein